MSGASMSASNSAISLDMSRIQELASSIAWQLQELSVFSDDFSVEENQEQVRGYLQNLIRPSNAEYDGDSSNASSMWTMEELHAAIKLAVPEWKRLRANSAGSATSAVATPKSFSLLDQLQGIGGSGFAMPLQLEDVLGIPTLQGQLEKLQSVEYLEDILPDWKAIREILNQGLRSEPVQGENETTVSQATIRLHRSWFHKGRSSPDYLGVQYHLCQNLAARITEQVQEGVLVAMDGTGLLFPLLQTWQDMFLDLLRQGHNYVGDEIRPIESHFMQWLQVPPVDHLEETARISVSQTLALLDPRGRVFASWLRHVPLERVKEFFLEPEAPSAGEKNSLCEKLIDRCHLSMPSSSLQECLQAHSLCLMTSLLETVRVAGLVQFLAVESNAATEEAALRQCAVVFLNALSIHERGSTGNSSTSTNSLPLWTQQRCCDALEIIWEGCQAQLGPETIKVLDGLETLAAGYASSKPEDTKTSQSSNDISTRLEELLDQIAKRTKKGAV